MGPMTNRRPASPGRRGPRRQTGSYLGSHLRSETMRTTFIAGQLVIAVLLGGLIASPQALAASNEKKPFGTTPDGSAVELYTLSNGKMSVDILTYGWNVNHTTQRQKEARN